MPSASLTPFIVGAGEPKYSAKPRSMESPMHTLCNTNHACVIAPVIARQFGASVGHCADEPSATITAGGGGKSQLVSAFLAKHYGGNYTGAGVGLDEPAHSVTTVDHHAVVAAHLMVNNTGHPGGSVDSPAHTVTTGNHHAVVASHLVKLRGTCRDGQRTDEPMPTITAGGQHVGEVKTTLAVEDYDEERAQQVLAFLQEYCGEECTGLVEIGGVTYRIVDIGMRMLQPHELYRAQGFPEWYIIDQDYRGVKYAKDKQVARCGNAVPPPFAEALVRANLPEICQSKDLAA
ncbi:MULTISPECIES: DNA cytosine methyltransferase [Klebsiella]|uniref:DNA cytosine methyltransferase n=1 Tax=Klebsiella TaxID=570 RepID=UPI0037509B52